MRVRIATWLAYGSGVTGCVTAVGWWTNMNHEVVHGLGSTAIALLAFAFAVHK